MLSESTEQYLKVIYNLTERGGTAKTTEIADAMHVAPASVTEMIRKLAREGYVAHEPYKGVVLRPKGRKAARRMARKHRLLERFLSDFMGVTEDATHDQACRMEHALTDDAEHRLCKMMHRPTECPHGSQIPRCERRLSCEKCTDDAVPLVDMKEGETAVISHLVSEDKDKLCRILSMGFVPGCEVTVEKKVPMGGPIIVSLKGTKVAIAREIGGILHMVRSS